MWISLPLQSGKTVGSFKIFVQQILQWKIVRPEKFSSRFLIGLSLDKFECKKGDTTLNIIEIVLVQVIGAKVKTG